MNQLGFPLLSIVLFVPLLGALVTLFLGNNRPALKAWALVVTLADLVLACVLWGFYNYGTADMQFVDRFAWIEPLGVSYFVGVDGISFWFLLLTVFLSPVAMLIACKYLDANPQVNARSYLFLMLMLETGVLGVFAAMDLILFYIFWEAMLVPMYFLIGRWGGERRIYAALKFFLYTMAGSTLMLVAIIALAVLNQQATGVLTFDLTQLYGLPLAWWPQIWLFVAFGLAFAVKAPIWPLHTWLPDAYVESSTPVTVMLAGVLSKMAVYGLIRFCLPLFPDAVLFFRPWVWLLAIVGILYGSLIALVQKDLKRLVAYSSMAHMGMLVAGVMSANAQGVQGAVIYSVSHGLTVTALFFFVYLLELRRNTRQVADFGGLWKSLPLLGTLFLVVILAAIGLPGLSGFPGEFTMLVGIFRESSAAAVFATAGIVLGAWYMLDMFRKTFAGPLVRAENRTLPDLTGREALVLLPLVVLMFVVGILPGLFLRPTDASVENLLSQADERRVVLREGLDGIAWAPEGESGAVAAGAYEYTHHGGSSFAVQSWVEGSR
jgi:NADH-quinone oxidoreductase subunit M